MLTYQDIKQKPTTLKAMTSLSRSEFDELLGVFATAWEEQADGRLRDASKGGRPPIIESPG